MLQASRNKRLKDRTPIFSRNQLVEAFGKTLVFAWLVCCDKGNRDSRKDSGHLDWMIERQNQCRFFLYCTSTWTQ